MTNLCNLIRLPGGTRTQIPAVWAGRRMDVPWKQLVLKFFFMFFWIFFWLFSERKRMSLYPLNQIYLFLPFSFTLLSLQSLQQRLKFTQCGRFTSGFVKRRSRWFEARHSSMGKRAVPDNNIFFFLLRVRVRPVALRSNRGSQYLRIITCLTAVCDV